MQITGFLPLFLKMRKMFFKELRELSEMFEFSFTQSLAILLGKTSKKSNLKLIGLDSIKLIIIIYEVIDF